VSSPPFDIAEVVPRIQRAIEGVHTDDWELSFGEAYLVTADALSDILLYTGSVFGSGLLITHRDPVTQAPDQFGTSVQLTPDQMSVVAAQAALTYFYQRFAGVKMQEQLADEASSWSYSLSPNLLIAQLKLLQDARDRALEAVSAQMGGLEAYISFLAVRDVTVARWIEPWVYGHPEGYGLGAGGLEGDSRFNLLPVGGGDYTSP
jgi:hypothetical protein